MKAHVDRVIADLISRTRKSEPVPERPRPLEPVPAGSFKDVREALPRKTRTPHGTVPSKVPAPSLDYDQIYDVEPTTWGVGSGFNPPPSPPPLPPSPWPTVPKPGPKAPPMPPMVLRHPPRPFRLFDGGVR